MIQQITVFLENKSGRLSSLCAALGEAGIDMQALTIADTADYRVNITRVTAIAVDNQPGGLAKLLAKLDDMNVNIEYGYCFSYKGEKAIDVLKIRDADVAEVAIKAAGYKLLDPADL